MENATPMFRQYLEIKKRHPGTLLFFRLGDFYELFSEDAVTGARELEITLTARQKDSPNPIPMCGVPHHAAASYISKLVRKGYRVAICEQSEPAAKGVKLVKRDVVRIITPGTAVDPQLSDAKEPVYLAAVSMVGDHVGAAFLEVSTGEFSATEFSTPDAWAKVRETIDSFSPLEILVSDSVKPLVSETFGVPVQQTLLNKDEAPTRVTLGVTLTSASGVIESYADAEQLLKRHFGLGDLAIFGLTGRNAAVSAAAACLRYAQETQRENAAHVSEINFFETNDFMVLDPITLRNLEIVESKGESGKKVLFSVIDETITGMGARLLRSWLMRPSVKRSEIQTRLAAVGELTDSILRDKLRFLLKDVTDLERLIGRLNLGTATPRDLSALGRSLERSPQMMASLADVSSLLLQVLAENIFELPEVRSLIDRAIAHEAPPTWSAGGVIRGGFDGELDELRELSLSGKQTIAKFEENEKQRTGIGNLKVRFNNVFGYYIEVSKGNVGRVPGDYERRQTLTNAERYTTPELKEWESKVLGADQRIIEIESRLFLEVREAVRAETPKLQSTARAVATLDVLASLAETAVKRNYVCPVLHDGDAIEIRNGRHPIVEAFIDEAFIPNDLFMNNSTDRILIITGANMGGKSTILRQAALIQILGQIGSFVPATSARLPIIDRIWTRVGASDDLASGRSTFMVEMTETATILHNATSRSLVLLDEIGRGTSTFDGLSIAWAVAEYLHDSPEHSCKTLFATHYHELTELAESLPGARNYQITAAEKDGEIVFLHKLKEGKAEKSYGIAVARLAGLPRTVIERASDVLRKLERYELAIFSDPKKSGLAKAASRSAASQMTLFGRSDEESSGTVSSTDGKEVVT